MRAFVLTMIVVEGITFGVSQVSAMPADGAAIAHIDQQVNVALTVATKKTPKVRAEAKSGAKRPCAIGYQPSNRTGYCRPRISNY